MATQHVLKNLIPSPIFRMGNADGTIRLERSGRYDGSVQEPFESTRLTMYRQLQHQREQIARDLHDGIGSQLTHIISRLDIMAFNNKSMESQLEALRDFTRETVQQLRETIWVLNQPEITYEQLSERIRGLLTRISTDMDYPKIKITSYGDGSLLLSPQLASSIFRIMQEAVNNALKYADASAISLCLASDSTSLTLLVSDNGKGFCLNDVPKGYGLLNIKRRTEELKGKLEINSSADGTNILVEFPLI
jgi:signal transduction histidine kinase